MVDTQTFHVEGPDGETETVELPAGLTDLLAEGGQTPTHVFADISLLAFAQRAHALAHHQEDGGEDVEEISEKAEELFEERFGVSFAEATGHQH